MHLRNAWGLTAQLIIGCILFGHSSILRGGPEHDHESKNKKNAQTKPETTFPIEIGKALPRASNSGSGNRPSSGCNVNPSALAAFANGESYEFATMVQFLANPNCQGHSRDIAQAALQEGIKFSASGPFRLDNYAASVLKGDGDSLKRTEIILAKSVPEILRADPMTTQELYPLLGQFAILSPEAARATLATMIRQELSNSDKLLREANNITSNTIARDLASTLMKFGANEPRIASQLAESVEDLALMSQADSLAQYFRALARATSLESSLASTFNLSASALNRGVQKNDPLYFLKDKLAMTKTVFEAIQAAVRGKQVLEAGASELNEALGVLLNGSSLQKTALKNFWKESIQILSESNQQTALAQAVAFSLTPKMILLPTEELGRLLIAARNYPEIASSIQANFLVAWQKTWRDLQAKKIKIGLFNTMKQKYFEPLVVEILTLEPYLIDNYWLGVVTARGLVKDNEVEKRFPKLVLASLERREKATQIADPSPSLEPLMASMTENFAVLWSLSQIHVPTLLQWVDRYEE